MEPTEGNNKAPAPSRNNTTVIVLLIVLIVAVVGLAAVMLLRGNGDSKEDNMTIGYATDAGVMLDQASLQAAMDAAAENAEKGNIALRYVNDATSTDGINFDCYIANSPANLYDMYLQLFADQDLQDQLFISGLVPPGSGYESVTLEHALDPGDHVVYVALTQVETEESGAQSIVNQVVYTMDFHVVTAE